MVYLLQTRISAALCYTVEELYSAILNRRVAPAMLYSADNPEMLRHLASIFQIRLYDANSDQNNPVQQISLPTTISESVYLQIPEPDDGSVSFNLMNLVQIGEWAISALNGFCTAPDDITLCKLLDAGTLAYPVAQWIEAEHENIVAAARQNYIRRFYSRYWYYTEKLFLPQCWFDSFLDKYFEEREKRRETILSENYNDFQTTRIAMGW